MTRMTFPAIVALILLSGCADNAPPKKGVHVDAPGVKVDVERKGDGRGVDVDVRTKK